MAYLTSGILVISACIFEGVVQSSSVTLTPSKEIVPENSTITLTCSSSDGKLFESVWTTSLHTEDAACAKTPTGCIRTSFLSNTSLYDCICNEDGTYSVLLKRVDRYYDGATWSCRALGSLARWTIVLVISVPVSSVMLRVTDVKPTHENSTATFSCITSYGLPAADIHWYRSKDSSTVELLKTDINVDITRSVIGRDDNLVSVEETLNYKVARSVHGWSIYCTANNWKENTVVSNKSELSVIYPPEQPPRIHSFINGSKYDVIEGTRASLSCSVEGGNPPGKPKWSCENVNSIPQEKVSGDNAVQLNLTWTAMRAQGQKCLCLTDHVLSTVFVFVVIDVLYPPMAPSIRLHYQEKTENVTGIVKLIEDRSYRLSCWADANPPPTNYSFKGPQNNDLSSNAIVSLLNIKRNQTGPYSCSAQNVMQPTYGEVVTRSNSSSIDIEVLYKPTVVRLNNVDEVEGKSMNISCIVLSANPPTTSAIWTRDIDNWSVPSHSMILQNISRMDASKYTCTLKNIMIPTIGQMVEGSGNDSFTLNVLFPPENTSLTYRNSKGTELSGIKDLSLLEGTTFTITCKSYSRPIPSYRWYVNGIKQNVSVISRTILRNEGGLYTCEAFNNMNRTFGDTVMGLDVKNTSIGVLYPAELKDSLSNVSAVEGGDFAVACPVVPGNPAYTVIQWSIDDGVNIANGNVFRIPNVTREDDRIYTCTIFNEMKPTDGALTTIPRISARVVSLSANGHSSTSMVIINDNESLSVKCTVESYPSADISLVMEDGVKKTTYGKSELFYNVTYSTYLNAGVYVCTGRNNYTQGEPSEKEIIIIVKSPPRPHPDDSNQTRRIYTKLHDNATMQFTVHPYLDETGTTTFSWYNGTSQIHSKDDRIHITSNGLQSELTLQGILRSDFGEYTLYVNNSIGSHIQLYEIIAQDKPDTPQKFSLVENSVTHSFVRVSWQPGFNGGSDQTFMVYYKTTQDAGWTETLVRDNGTSSMEYTIKELMSDTDYMIKIQASNEEGYSGESEILQFRTRSVPTKSRPNMTAALAGGTVTGLMIVLGLVFTVWFFRKRFTIKIHRKATGGHAPLSDNFEIQTIAGEDTAGNERFYDHIKPVQERATVDRQELTYESLRSDKDAFGDTSPVYVNLKLS